LVCTALLENGFNVNKQNSIDNETAIFIATQNHNDNDNADILLQILIQNGGNPDLPNNKGNTPLILVASKEPADKKATDKEIVKLLIEYEANIEHRNIDGKSALDLATNDIKPILIKAMKSMKNRKMYKFKLSEIEIDNTRLLYDSIMGDETPIKDYLQLDPSNKVLIIGNFILGINAEAFLKQYKDSKNRYEHKFYECKNVLSRWPKRSDIEWTTGAMFNLIKIGPHGGFIDFDIFFGILNSKDRLFELRKIKEMPAITGLQMLHHEPQASSSEHCQGGAMNDYYEVRKVQYDKRLSSPTKSPTPTKKTASPTSQQSKRGRRGGKKTRRRRQKV
jgi:hypothetical protein